jgi:hypothetical protein
VWLGVYVKESVACILPSDILIPSFEFIQFSSDLQEKKMTEPRKLRSGFVRPWYQPPPQRTPSAPVAPATLVVESDDDESDLGDYTLVIDEHQDEDEDDVDCDDDEMTEDIDEVDEEGGGKEGGVERGGGEDEDDDDTDSVINTDLEDDLFS